MKELRFGLEVGEAGAMALRISDGTRRERERLLQALDSVEEGDLLLVDLAGQPLNSSVLDEMLCKSFLRRLRDPDEPVVYAVLTGVHAHSAQELNYGARASGKSNVVFPARMEDGVRLLGAPSAEVARSYERLVDAGQLTARDLADADGVRINVAHNRLKQLHDLRIAIKEGPVPAEGGGRQHVYKPVQ